MKHPAVLLPALICAAAFWFSSCAGAPDTAARTASGGAPAYEQQLAALDAARIQGSIVRVAQIWELGETLAELAENGDITQQDYLALTGRLELIQGHTPQAKRSYEQAAALSAQNIQVQILAVRLEPDPQARLLRAEEIRRAGNTDPRIVLEQAIAAYQMQDFRLAQAYFDAAQAQLDGPLIAAYGALRAEVQAAQTADGGESPSLSDYAQAAELSAQGMLMLTQSETTFLQELTGVELLSAEALYARARDAGLLPQALSGGGERIVTRAQCAQYLWQFYRAAHHITADYAAKYRTAAIEQQKDGLEPAADGASQPYSPIADVALDAPEFSAIAGCVENRIMSLDAQGFFYPDLPISGAEFTAAVRAAQGL